MRLAQNGALDIIMDFVSERPRGALAPVYADLWYLYKTVRKTKPRAILEFGSGCSTAILAKALSDNREGFLYSVDSSSDWTDSTTAAIPSFLKRFFEISYSPITVEISQNGLRLVRHQKIPIVVPNLVFLDGPPLAAGEVAVDLLEMEDCFPPGFVLVIDKRNENTEFLRRRLKRNYAFGKKRNLSLFVLKSS